MRKGLTTLIVVTMVAILALFVLLTWQSRLLLAIYRHRSLSDVIAADYAAETEVFDLAYKFLTYEDFDIDTPYTKVFGSNQVVQVDPSGSATNRKLSILGKWPFATANLELVKQVNQTNSSAIDKVEIVMAIDCSGSMVGKADQTCSGPAITSCPTRIMKAQEAIKAFLGEITSLPAAERDKYYFAFMPFKRTAAWLKDGSGADMLPSNDFAALTTIANTAVPTDGAPAGPGIWNEPAMSPLCRASGLYDIGVPGGPETNLGDSGILANSYFVADPKVKQAYILFTDGLPNTSRASAFCGTTMCNASAGCTEQSINYLKCSLGEKTNQWRPGFFGTRNTETDVYAVTVADRGEDTDAYDKTKAVFEDPAYVKKSFINSNANELPGYFKDIFNSIKNSTTNINFSRIVPSPEP